MSLILEALRKSEAERRRGQAPDVAMELPPTAVARPRALASWLLPVLVVAGLLVLAGWWIRHEPAETAPPETAIEATQTAPAFVDPVPAAMPRIEPKPVTPVVANTSTPAIAAPVAAPPAKPTPASTAAPAPDVAATRPAPVQPMPTAPVPTRPLLPPASAISNDTSMLPPIKLSMHMWDDVPARRFVIINGQRMAEGEHYGGITVIAIERNGVVVEGNGNRARVPLP